MACGSSSPIWAGRRRAGVDDPHLAVLRVDERDAGVGRDSGRDGHTGNDLDAELGLRARGGFFGTVTVEHRIAREQPHHALARLDRVDDDLRALRLGQRPIRLNRRQVDDQGVGTTVPREVGGRQLVGDHDVGATEQVDRAQRQETGVAWSGADERHRADDAAARDAGAA